MKKRMGLLLWAVIFSGGYHAYAQQQSKPKQAQPTKPTAAAAAAKKQEIEDGKILLSKSDCLACHKLQEKLVGPAYAAIAKKYPDTDASITKLTAKVISGGSGVWGEIPMAPHAALTQADARKMVRYILSVKSETK